MRRMNVQGHVSPRLARFLILKSKKKYPVPTTSTTTTTTTTSTTTGKIIRVLYHQHPSRDLAFLLTHLPLHSFIAFNDMRQVYEKCGPSCYFLNAVRIVRMKHFDSKDSKYFTDLVLALQFQIATGKLLQLNREGLARHDGRSVFEVIVFEAMKKNCVRMVTRGLNEETVLHGNCFLLQDDNILKDSSSSSSSSIPSFEYSALECSTDRMAMGIPFLEGTGFHFAVKPYLVEEEEEEKKENEWGHKGSFGFRESELH